MAHLKGMDTWMWIVGGIIITLLCFGIFLEIFSSLTAQTHTQASLESSTSLATDANKLCMMTEGQSLSQTLKFSTLVTDFYSTSYENKSYVIEGSRTYGRKLCTNISGMVSCEDLDCTLELEDIIKQKKVLNFLDKLQGALTYREYPLEITRTKCGVSALGKGSTPGCVCGTGEFETPIQCDYNGLQPVLLSKENLVILTDAEAWIVKNQSLEPVSEKLFSNIAGYLGGQNILIIFEENMTNPENTVMKDVLASLGSNGFWIHAKGRTSSSVNPPGGNTTLHTSNDSTAYASSSIDFSNYDQVWLITPGFCEAESRNCTDYARWTVGEKKRLIEFAKSGKGLLIVTDAAMTKGIYDNVDVTLLNSILFEMNLPFEQVPSCVCGCDGQPMKPNQTIYSNNSNLTAGLEYIPVIGAAVLRETCVYDPNILGNSKNASCGPDGLCAKNCPSGDRDCSCLEEGGYLCQSAAYCAAPSTVKAHADPGICCSNRCYLPGSESCPETHDKAEGNACLCTAECLTGLSCDATKHCCSAGTLWNGTRCARGLVCSSPAAPCNDNFHWTHFGSGRFHENVGEPGNAPCGGGYSGTPCPSCDYFEVCQSPVVKPIAEEIVSCCNSKCTDSSGHGSCHQYCTNAVSNSGLSSSENEDTLKKCYGLYAIYGMGPAATWTQGYQEHIEQPASVMLSSGVWMCTGYSTMLTTIMRSVGYTATEAYTVLSDDHAYNIIKFPGDPKYTIADTVGNRPHPVGLGSLPTGYPHCSYWLNSCSNDAGMVNCPAKNNVYGCG